jgi:hypothetical protein
MVRGGRMLKFKGAVVSAAPNLQQAVSKAAWYTFASTVGACHLLFSNEAWAINECGVVAGANPIVICDDINNGAANETGEVNVSPNSETSDTATHAGGIYYASRGLTLNLDGTTSPFVVNRPTSYGVYSVSNGVQDHIVNAMGEVNVTAGLWFGIAAGNNSGAVTINFEGGKITTVNDYTVSTYSICQGTGDATVNFRSGEVVTSGYRAYGPTAWSVGAGNAIVNFDSGSVSTMGGNAYGVYADPYSGTGDGTVIVRSGTITTMGYEAIGAHVYVVGPGALLIDIGQGTSIDTSGILANGILGTIQDTTNAASLELFHAGDIKTTGTNAYGVWGWHGGSGKIFVENSGNVDSSGVGASGLRAEADTTATYEVNVTGGRIISGTGTAAGVHVIGASGGSINISSDAIIDSSGSGLAIRDGDRWTDTNGDGIFERYDPDGVDEIGGDVVVTTAGTVTGDAILGLGDDTFNLTGGAYTGDIYGDDIAASKNDGIDQFTWSGGKLSGGFYGQNGSDNAIISGTAMFDGDEMLDGGDDSETGDGWIDILTFAGASGIVNGKNIRNWEVVQFAGPGTTQINDFVTLSVNVCGGSVILGGASMANDVLGCVSDDTITITDNTVISNVIEGAGGADTINVLGNASVTGGVYGGGAGQDASVAADTGDTITINTTGTVGGIDSGAGVDIVAIDAGTIAGTVFLRSGDDVLIMNGGLLTVLPSEGNFDAGTGKDEIYLNGGTLTGGVGGDGDDLLVLDGATVTQGLDGSADNDTIRLLSGTSPAVGGGEGDDSILLAGAEIGIIAGDAAGTLAVDGLALLR